ncbi:hypothetical protein NQ317_002923 [Molorchus minor]|uniref:Uncharacterized protein n=1 Tax=Molorchus minor TaxID=1323400 RepID=A0ABQ9J6Y8_9CUCU|nr:hypothetical protein NQ317_002923 [Molorchus minor]
MDQSVMKIRRPRSLTGVQIGVATALGIIGVEMSSFFNWQKKQYGNPNLLIIAVVGFTFSFYGFYRYGYKPWSKKRKMHEAEEYADYILSIEANKETSK